MRGKEIGWQMNDIIRNYDNINKKEEDLARDSDNPGKIIFCTATERNKIGLGQNLRQSPEMFTALHKTSRQLGK
jgi:hypothetical protein